jgi:hypothetical protein
VSQLWIRAGERSSLLTHIAATESGSLKQCGDSYRSIDPIGAAR